MTTKQAYDAIPHLQVTFEAAKAESMPSEEAQYLERFFALVDLAVIERVQTMRAFHGNGGADNRNSMEILRRMEALPVPEKLKTAHDLVVTAVFEEKQFLDAWRENRNTQISRTDPRLGSISRKLIQAYQIYMSGYPNEGEHNRNAFYQHLCALDFL